MSYATSLLWTGLPTKNMSSRMYSNKKPRDMTRMQPKKTVEIHQTQAAAVEAVEAIVEVIVVETQKEEMVVSKKKRMMMRARVHLEVSVVKNLKN